MSLKVKERPFLFISLVIVSYALSFYLGFAYGIAGVIAAWSWAWYELTLEIIRILRTPHKRSYDGNTQTSKKAMEKFIESIEDEDFH